MPAWKKNNSGELTITDKDKDGSLVATGGAGGAGIGGGFKGEGRHITIEGGEIVATGGLAATGIGGGELGDGSHIIITDSEVTATGGAFAAGIGGGSHSCGDSITISNSTVNATSLGGGGAGIGGARDGRNIIITDSTITATGAHGAGIGGGEFTNGHYIIITDSKVIAKSTAGAGIGGGIQGSGTKIIITRSEVTAESMNGAGIGAGFRLRHSSAAPGNGQDIAIFDSILTIHGGSSSAGIGGSRNGNGSRITISDSTGTVIGGPGGAGIGGGLDGKGSDITISGSTALIVQGGHAYFEDDQPDLYYQWAGAGIGNGGGSVISEIYLDTDYTAQYGDHTGEEVAPDVATLTDTGYILYYATDADMSAAQTTESIHYGNTDKHSGMTVTPAVAATCTSEGSTIGLHCDCGEFHIEPETVKKTEHTWENGKCSVCGEPEPISAPEDSDTQSAPLYRVTDKNGKKISYKAEQKDSVLTVTVDADFAILTGTLNGINMLKAQGVEKIVFVTKNAISTFTLADLLEKGSRGEVYKLIHDAKTVTFAIDASSTDVSDILEKS